MRDLFSRSEFQEVNIIIALYEDNKWWTVQEIADLTNCSIDTAYSLINNINNFSSQHDQDYYIDTKKTKGVFLITGDDFSISSVYALYIYHSNRYKLIDMLFQTPDLTTDKLAAELYVSKSTIYRELKNIQQILALSNLALNIATLEIVGDETLIRHLMLNLYFPVLNFVKWPFIGISEDLIDHRKKELFPDLYLSFMPNSSLKLSCQLAINFIRHLNKKYIDVMHSASSIDPIRQETVSAIETIYQNSIPQNYRQNELDYIASFGLITDFCVVDSEKISTITKFHQDTQTKNFALYELLSAHFNDIYPENMIFYMPVFQFRILSMATYALTYPRLQLDPEAIEELYDYFFKQTPYLMANLQTIVEKIYAATEFSHSLISMNDFIIELYLILSEFVDLRSLEKPILVKVIDHYPAFEEIIKQQLEKKVNLNLKIDTSLNGVADNIVYDLIVHGTDKIKHSALKSKQEYVCTNFLSERNWQNITSILEKISLE